MIDKTIIVNSTTEEEMRWVGQFLDVNVDNILKIDGKYYNVIGKVIDLDKNILILVVEPNTNYQKTQK